MRWKKARPMNETSSTMSNTAFSHCFSKARNCSPFSSFLNIAFGKMWNAEHAVWAPNPMLNAATPVYVVSSTVAWPVAGDADAMGLSCGLWPVLQGKGGKPGLWPGLWPPLSDHAHALVDVSPLHRIVDVSPLHRIPVRMAVMRVMATRLPYHQAWPVAVTCGRAL